jgi:hypothetical protein
MAEIAIVATLSLAGVGVLAPVQHRLPRPAVVAMAFPVGAAAYLFVVTVLVSLGRSLEPGFALALTAAVGIGAIGAAAARRSVGLDFVVSAVLAVGVAAGLAWLFRTVHLTRLTIDSMRYLLASLDLQRPGGIEEVFRPDLLKRQLGLPALHALSGLTDRRYLASIGPLYGISGIGFLGWLVWSRTLAWDLRRRWLLTVTAVAFLLAANRLLYDLFYVNTHIEVASLLVIGVAGMWLALVDDEPAWAVPAGLCLAATLLFRPEAPLVAAIVLIPLAASRAGWATRWAFLAPVLALTGLWYGVVLWSHAIDGSEVSLTAPVFGNLVAVALVAGLVLAGGLRRWAVLPRLAQRAMLPGLALAIAVFAAIDPSVLFESLGATAINVGKYGLWLFTWTVAVPLMAMALLVHRFRESRVWTDSIIGFALLFFLLPYVRESAWRVGSGDSGNRILAHILLVAVAFLVLAAVEGRDELEVAVPATSDDRQ